jgi:hypothetical protein
MITRIMFGRSLVIRKKILVEKTLSLCRVGTDACMCERGCGGAQIGGGPRSGPGTLSYNSPYLFRSSFHLQHLIKPVSWLAVSKVQVVYI